MHLSCCYLRINSLVERYKETEIGTEKERDKQSDRTDEAKTNSERQRHVLRGLHHTQKQTRFKT